jgi:glycosyltransferase involved in cell wall biosynthesis
MKIAMTHVDLPNESRGGVAFQAHYLANALAERGHAVTLFTFSPVYADCRYQVHQYSLPSSLRRLKSFVFAAHLAGTDFSAFDVIHTHGDNYLLWNRHPQLRTFHGSAKDEAASAVRLRRRIYQTVLARLEPIAAWVADVNVGVSQATQRRIPTISTLIPCGVDTTHFCPGRKSDRPSILFVGTVAGRKRGQFLSNVFIQQVRSQIPDAELWAVTDRPLAGEGIINFGKVSFATLVNLYQQAWLFCLPSTYEGFGVPYIEAMAAGTAVIATPNPGAREVLCDGEYGVIVEDTHLGEQINHLLGNAELRQAYLTKGLLRAQEFSWQRVAQSYEKLYADLLKSSHHSPLWGVQN